MNQQSAATKLIRPCDDCGEQVEVILYSGLQLGRSCGPCREKRMRLEELDRQQRHIASLARHREEWLTDPVRGIPPKFQGLSWDAVGELGTPLIGNGAPQANA